MTSFMKQLNNDMADMLVRAQPALVRVASGRRGMGSGIIWGANGLIVTNAHVVHRRGPSVIFADDAKLPAQVLGIDRQNDLAALQVDASDLPAIEVGRSRELRSGQVVVALGFPWGITGAVTTGIVVATGENLMGMPGGSRELIAVSLQLRPGFSGGPLIDDQGRVIGVNVMMAGPEIGLAIPAHVVEDFLSKVAAQHHQPAPESEAMASPAVSV